MHLDEDGVLQLDFHSICAIAAVAIELYDNDPAQRLMYKSFKDWCLSKLADGDVVKSRSGEDTVKFIIS